MTAPSTPRPDASDSPRLVTGAAAVALAVLIGLATVLTADPDPSRGAGVAAWFAGGALLAVFGGLVRRLVALVGVGTVLLGVAYGAGHVHAGNAVPGAAVVIGPALLAMAELAAWSIDLSPAAHDGPGVFRARGGWLAASAFGAIALALLLAGLARVRLAPDLPLDALAVVAAVSMLGLAAALARR